MLDTENSVVIYHHLKFVEHVVKKRQRKCILNMSTFTNAYYFILLLFIEAAMRWVEERRMEMKDR